MTQTPTRTHVDSPHRLRLQDHQLAPHSTSTDLTLAGGGLWHHSTNVPLCFAAAAAARRPPVRPPSIAHRKTLIRAESTEYFLVSFKVLDSLPDALMHESNEVEISFKEFVVRVCVRFAVW